jgi:hypothetical protein
MPALSVTRPDRPVTPFTPGTIAVGATAMPVRCLPIQSIASVLEPGIDQGAAGPGDLAAEWLAVVDEPGMGFELAETAAVVESFMAAAPRLRRRQRGVASRAALLGCVAGS